ncbi:MAG TPA: hypothetical protein VN905_01125 [Candidatus Binatia bacterium]|nr:hypothetical protein [Candidatus Binatia bacterium]
MASSTAAAPQLRLPLWTRTLTTVTTSFDRPSAPAGEGTALVGSSNGIAALDLTSGKTRWFIPAVDYFAVAGDVVVFGRSTALFAVRVDHGGILWKKPCVVPFVLAVGDRVVTICNGNVAIVRARDGALLASRRLDQRASGSTYGAAPINDDFFELDGNHELSTTFSVIDAHAGRYVWGKGGETQVLASGKTWIDITPDRSRFPWADSGTVERRGLSDGKLLSTKHYSFPGPDEGHGLPLDVSTAAAYGLAGNGQLYRVPLGSTEAARVYQTDAPTTGAVVLGASAFFGVPQNNDTTSAPMFVDRAQAGRFVVAPLGEFESAFGKRSFAMRVADHVALAAHGTVTLFDERGEATAQLQVGCRNVEAIDATAKRYVVVCYDAFRPTVLAFSRD